MTPSVTIEELAEIILAKINLKNRSACDLYVRSHLTVSEIYKILNLPTKRIGNMYGYHYLDHKPSFLWTWSDQQLNETRIEWAVRSAIDILSYGGIITAMGFEGARINLGPTKKVKDPFTQKILILQ